MPFLLTFVRRYPKQSILMLIAMLLAGMAEGIGLSAMLPLLNIAIGSQSAGHIANSPAAERMVREGLEVLGIPPTLEALIMVIFAAIILKSGLILLANKRIGFAVAQVATDLRLEFLRAFVGFSLEISPSPTHRRPGEYDDYRSRQNEQGLSVRRHNDHCVNSGPYIGDRCIYGVREGNCGCHHRWFDDLLYIAPPY